MSEPWNNDQAVERFAELWKGQHRSKMNHSGEQWDERAHQWEKGLRTNRVRKDRSEKRVEDVRAFLVAHGALTETSDVIDIGCGPGRFVAAFAEQAHHVTGTDLSEQMCRYGEEFAASKGLTNTSFVPCDFRTADIDVMGWREKFDLVFSCITPAVSTIESYRKVMAMSRKWCFSGVFVNLEDALPAEICRNVFGKEYPKRWDGRTVYSAFNILWLEGYLPILSYYEEGGTREYSADRDEAVHLVDALRMDCRDEAVVEKVYRYLKEKEERGESFVYPFGCTYAWMLWDVTKKIDRSGYNHQSR